MLELMAQIYEFQLIVVRMVFVSFGVVAAILGLYALFASRQSNDDD